ncbi:hypothetical protein [Bacillus mobilis]|uniref:hypothetical protein n=1 Tax=Bacillus mobilis TaxID=2026190 RepID=UPI0036A58643
MSEPKKNYTNIEFEMMLDNMIQMMPIQIKYFDELSKLYRARFDSLVKEGFTEQQALEIIKSRGIE